MREAALPAMQFDYFTPSEPREMDFVDSILRDESAKARGKVVSRHRLNWDGDSPNFLGLRESPRPHFGLM